MKGNQGLEALAALCGGQADAPTETSSSRADDSQSEGGASSVVVGRATQLEQQQQQQQQQQLQQQSTLPNQQQSPLNNVTPQQWQQAIAAAAALNPAFAAQSAAQSILLSAGLSPHATLGGGGGGGDNAFMQQLALHQYVQAAKLSAQQAAQLSSGGAPKAPSGFDQNQQAVLMALAAGKAQQLNQAHGGTHELSQQLQQVIPAASNNNNAQPQNTMTGGNSNNNGTSAAAAVSAALSAAAPGTQATTAAAAMKPPPPPSSQSALPSALSNAGISAAHHVSAHANIAPMPGGRILPSGTDLTAASAQHPVTPTGTAANSGGGAMMGVNDKKQMKRAANRRSAQLSRKRKKQYIEELKEENDDLRRKELILKSIPDLIVVFDSSGKLGFVSESVSRFIDMTPEELEGTSFWNRLCEDSVRLLKAAFMDSLAARKPDSDTAPLGSGVWELRLIDKDSSHLVVSLNGVVHFSGEAPECVCCIRPRDMQPIQKLPKKQKTSANVAARAVSSSDGSRTSSDNNSGDDELQIRAKPSQSVMGNSDTTSTDVSVANKRQRLERKPAGRSNNEEDGRIIGNDGQVVRISDGDSGCEISESGSDD